jgi:hypothetical protein
VFQASSAACTLVRALSRSNGGSGGRSVMSGLLAGFSRFFN